MSITVDEIVDVDAEEHNGRIVRLRRKVKLLGVTATTQLGAIAEIRAAGVLPPGGSVTSVNGDILWLRNRSISIREGSDMADVVLSYEGGQAPGATVLTRGGDGSLAQIHTVKDREGNLLEVEHNGITQGGELNVFVPQDSPFFTTIENTTNPAGLQNEWLGYVNSTPWRGKPAGKWIISRVRHEEFNVQANLWKFNWSMQESPESQGWLPVIAWTDPNSNKPGVGLVDDVGVKTVPWYFQRDFNSKFS